MDAKEQRAAFVRALEANPDDDACRLVFADFLDEHDEPEEADRMRRWRASKDWMVAFAAEYGGTGEGYSPRQIRDWEMDEDVGEDWRPTDWEELVKAAADYKRTGDHFTQIGHEDLRNFGNVPENRRLFWDHWEVLTGDKRPTQDPWLAANPGFDRLDGEADDPNGHSPFSCSC